MRTPCFLRREAICVFTASAAAGGKCGGLCPAASIMCPRKRDHGRDTQRLQDAGIHRRVAPSS